jgi:hypothetical protein
MSHLVPCPSCSRHVRTSESECPFCGSGLELSSVPAPVLPATRLGRAATFAFGATLLSATAMVACGGDSEDDGGGNAGSSGTTATGGMAGNATGGSSSGAGGRGGSAGSAGSAGADGGVAGSIAPPYGFPPMGGDGGTAGGGDQSGGTAGGAVPLYGAAPAD